MEALLEVTAWASRLSCSLAPPVPSGTEGSPWGLAVCHNHTQARNVGNMLGTVISLDL